MLPPQANDGLFYAMTGFQYICATVQRTESCKTQVYEMQLKYPTDFTLNDGKELTDRFINFAVVLINSLPVPPPEYLLMKHVNMLEKICKNCESIVIKMEARCVELAAQQNQ